jgi:hypothetical protein
MSIPMLKPKLTPASPERVALGGCQARETKEDASAAPMRE